jgi:hypothetical protein
MGASGVAREWDKLASSYVLSMSKAKGVGWVQEGVKKQAVEVKGSAKRSRPEDTVYDVGTELKVEWPLISGGASTCRAVIAERECRFPKRKRARVSAFRYKLAWTDGSTPSWSRLLHLPHEIVPQICTTSAPQKKSEDIIATWPSEGSSMNLEKDAPFPWECDEADHAESPLGAYEHAAPMLLKLAKLLGKDAASLQIYDP